MSSDKYPLIRSARIINPLGLHIRSAARLSRLAQKARAQVWLIKDKERADAGNLFDMLALACPAGTDICIAVEDAQDTGVLDAMIEMVEQGFGEMPSDEG